jgi:hypothetical protein
MKSTTLIALIFLALIVGSSAIQVREKSELTRRHRRHHRNNRKIRNSLDDEAKTDLWGAIKKIFNKEDFRFTLGASLKLLDALDFPYSVSIFFRQSDNVSESGWDFEFGPKNKAAVETSLEKVKKEDEGTFTKLMKKYTNSQTIAEMIVKAAEDTAVAFVTDLITQAAKAVIVAIFPPIAPVFAIYSLIKSSGVYLTKDKEAEKAGKADLYKLGYTYTLKIITGVKVKLYVEVRLNFHELKAVLNVYKERVLKWVREQYDRLPGPVKEVINAAGELATAIAHDIEDFVNCLRDAYLEGRKILVETVAALIDKVKESELGQWFLDFASKVVTQLDVILAEVSRYWNHFTSVASSIGSQVVTFLRDAYNNSISWLKSVGDAISDFFSNLFSKRHYRRLFMRANRRFFRMARRNRMHRRSRY